MLAGCSRWWAALVLAGVWAGSGSLPAQDAGAVLTNASQVRALGHEPARGRQPIRLRGVVTGEGGSGIFIQDDTAGIFVYRWKLDVSWARRGDLLEVEGVSDPGNFAPVVWPTRISKLGTAPLPEARWATLDGLAGGAMDAQWIQVVGVVRECHQRSNYHFDLELAIGGMRLAVQYYGPTNSHTLGFVDAEAHVTGVCTYEFNRSGQVLHPVLMVPGYANLELVTSPASPWTAPLRRARNILRFSPEATRCHRVRVQGTVLYHLAGETLWVRDGGYGVRIETKQAQQLRPGDSVEAAGFPASGALNPFLEDAICRPLSSTESPPQPVTVTNKADAAIHDADLIRLSARLTDLTRTLDGWILTLAWQDETLRADLQGAAVLPKNWEAGALVQATGICRATTDAGKRSDNGSQSSQEVKMFLRSTRDLAVLQPPLWWNRRHVLVLLCLITGVSLVIASAVLWVARTRLREQGLRRAMAEAEFSAMLAERNRIAREIHDTLAQGLGAISMHLELVKDQFGREPSKVLKHLDIAHQMVRQSLQEARSSIWNMRSQILEDCDLASALRGILRQLVDGTGIEGCFVLEGSVRPLAPAIENNLLRVGQEAIANAVKHARAKRIVLTLDYSGAEILLSVRDDGGGFDPEHLPKGEHFGILGQRERTAQLGGRLEVKSSPGQGTELSVRIPFYD